MKPLRKQLETESHKGKYLFCYRIVLREVQPRSCKSSCLSCRSSRHPYMRSLARSLVRGDKTHCLEAARQASTAARNVCLSDEKYFYLIFPFLVWPRRPATRLDATRLSHLASRLTAHLSAHGPTPPIGLPVRPLQCNHLRKKFEAAIEAGRQRGEKRVHDVRDDSEDKFYTSRPPELAGRNLT